MLENEPIEEHLNDVSAILVPGGFGQRGTEGKIAAIRYAREHKIPFLGICLGMQMAVIETMRNVAGIKNAGTTEFDANCEPVVGLMTEWDKEGAKEIRRHDAQSTKVRYPWSKVTTRHYVLWRPRSWQKSNGRLFN